MRCWSGRASACAHKYCARSTPSSLSPAYDCHCTRLITPTFFYFTTLQPDLGSDVDAYSALTFTQLFGHVDVKVCTDFQIMTNAVHEIKQEKLFYFAAYRFPVPKHHYIDIFLDCIQKDRHVKKFTTFEELEAFCVETPHCMLLNCQLCSLLYRRSIHDEYRPAAARIAVDMFKLFDPILSIDAEQFLEAKKFERHCVQPTLLFRNNEFHNIMKQILIKRFRKW